MSESRGSDDDDAEWAVTLEDLEDDGEPAYPEPAPIEPGSPTLEGTVFVVLGIALAVAVVLVGV